MLYEYPLVYYTVNFFFVFPKFYWPLTRQYWQYWWLQTLANLVSILKLHLVIICMLIFNCWLEKCVALNASSMSDGGIMIIPLNSFTLSKSIIVWFAPHDL